MNRIAFIVVLFLFVFCSCKNNKRIKIVVDDIESCCNMSVFRGIEPDIYFKDLCERVGEPNEYIDMNRGGGEICHNPIYYFKEAKIMCYWSGSKRDEIGVVDYIPYNNSHISIDSFFTCPLDNYEITSETTNIGIYENNVFYFGIGLKNYEIEQISFWKIER